MPKRKPPSQRPESQMDETARAIAEQREQARSEKSPKTDRVGTGGLKPQANQLSAGAGNRRNVVAPAASTRRRKTGGG